MQFDVDFSVLIEKALVGHVPGRALSANEYFTILGQTCNVLHVGTDPAVGLSVHGFWTQSGGNKENGVF
jgi:hypothetical protein